MIRLKINGNYTKKTKSLVRNAVILFFLIALASLNMQDWNQASIPEINGIKDNSLQFVPSRSDRGPAAKTAATINVACVFATGGLGDKGWGFNNITKAGLDKAVADGLCTYTYSLPSSSSEYEGLLSGYASSGSYDLIVAIGWDQVTAVNNVATSYPSQAIVLIDAIVSQGNVSSVIFEEQEGSFLVGAIAGLMSLTGKVGFIGGMDIPLIREFWAGYKAGVLYERNNSYIEVIENYVGAWDDQVTAKSMAEAMWAQGVDIIFAAAGKSGLGVLESANETAGVYAIGVDADQDYLYPGKILTSMVKRVDVAVYNVIKDVSDGSWIAGTQTLGLTENGVGISNLTYTDNLIGAANIQKVNVTIRNNITSGDFTVPTSAAELDQWIIDMNITVLDINQFELIDYDMTYTGTGIQFTSTIKNNGDPLTAGSVNISWESFSYDLPLSSGTGTLDESVVDYDLNGDGDKIDTFSVTWTPNATRPWDATVGGNYVYALYDTSVSRRNFIRSYYIDGQSKLFQLGSKTHFLYFADNDVASFGFDSHIRQHPGPNYELIFYSNVSATDFKINGNPIEVNYSTMFPGILVDGTKVVVTAYIIPDQATAIGTGEEVTISCTIIPLEETTPTMYVVVNWSPDSNTRYFWVPFLYETWNTVPDVNQFELIDYDMTSTGTGFEFTSTIKNNGDPLMPGPVPIALGDFGYDLPLFSGSGILDESIVVYDLNGDGDKVDTFDVAWAPNATRPWDATIDGVHVYALLDTSVSRRNFNRSYYIDGKSKLFQLGSKTHFLNVADNNIASFGFDAHIQQHPGPNYELIFYSNVSATGFKINGNPVEVNYTYTGPEIWADGTKHDLTIYIIPNQATAIDTGEEVTISCTIVPLEERTPTTYVVVNWSPDSNTRYVWIPFWYETWNTVPSVNQFELIDYSLTPIGTSYQFTSTIKNNGDPLMPGPVPILWEELSYYLPLDNGVGTLDESIVDYDLNGDGDKIDTFDVAWAPNATRPWDATIDSVHVYALADTTANPRYFNRSCYIDGKPKLFQLGSETHVLYSADNVGALFGVNTTIKQHPGPNYRLIFYSNVSATDFKINGNAVEINYTALIPEIWADGSIHNVMVYIIPGQVSAIKTGEEVTISCTILQHQGMTHITGLLVNWSPDSNTRYTWAPLWHELSPPSLTFPIEGETLSGNVDITWSPAVDNWNHAVNYDVYYSPDEGNSWTPLVTGLTSTSYTWDTTAVADGTGYLVKVIATCEKGFTAETTTDNTFTIKNAIPTSTTTTTTTPTTTATSVTFTPGLRAITLFLSAVAIITVRKARKKHR